MTKQSKVSMELHAIWNRIDQLEKLLISQAKEIDFLRRIINSTQISVQSIASSQRNNPGNNNNNSTNNSSTIQMVHKPYMGTQVINDRNSIQLSSISTKGNQQVNIFNKPTTTFHQPTYLMNSFVHPAIAIPPTNLVQTYNMNNNNQLNLESKSNIVCGNFTNSTSTIISASKQSTTNMNRWSVGPNLRLLDNIVDKSEPTTTTTITGLESQDHLTEMPNGRHKRQSFVEILTCFCPCFSMC